MGSGAAGRGEEKTEEGREEEENEAGWFGDLAGLRNQQEIGTMLWTKWTKWTRAGKRGVDEVDAVRENARGWTEWIRGIWYNPMAFGAAVAIILILGMGAASVVYYEFPDNGAISFGTTPKFRGLYDATNARFEARDGVENVMVHLTDAGTTGNLTVTGDVAVTGTLTAGTWSVPASVAHLDVAETITADWVNTAYPWADNEVADTLTIGSSSTVADAALSSTVANLGTAETITENWVNTANPWADNEVADTLTIGSSSTVADAALSSTVANLGTAETITENWVNTAYPWADNEVADTLTIGSSSTVADAALSSSVANLGTAETITENWVNTAYPWADNEVADALTISGGSVNNSIIGGSTAAAATVTSLTVGTTADFNGDENRFDYQILIGGLKGGVSAAAGMVQWTGTAFQGYSGTGWVPLSIATIDDIPDVDLTGLADDYILKYNSSTTHFEVAVDATGTADVDLGDDEYISLGDTAEIALGYNGTSNKAEFVDNAGTPNVLATLTDAGTTGNLAVTGDVDAGGAIKIDGSQIATTDLSDESSIMKEITVAGDSGTVGIGDAETLTFAGGTDIATAVSGNTVTINFDGSGGRVASDGPYFVSHFLGTVLPDECTAAAAGTGSTSAFLAGIGGWYRLTAGTTLSASTVLNIGSSSSYPTWSVTKDCTLSARMLSGAMANAGSAIYVGLINNPFLNDDCAYFKLTKGTNSDLWQTITANENTATTNNTTSGYTSEQTLSIVAGSSSVVFLINGTEVATHTTNLPNETMWFTIIGLQGGNPGTAWNIDVNYVEIGQDE